MFKKISERIGLTPTEIKVLFFLLIVFLTGYAVKTFYLTGDESLKQEFNYSALDSTFNSSIENTDTLSSGKNLFTDKKVDYKQEVLDFKNQGSRGFGKKTIPAKNSININTAGIKEFSGLPGIGSKTAEKIIIFRKKIGRFRKLNELLQVKGIGNSKYLNIKEYLYVE